MRTLLFLGLVLVSTCGCQRAEDLSSLPTARPIQVATASATAIPAAAADEVAELEEAEATEELSVASRAVDALDEAELVAESARLADQPLPDILAPEVATTLQGTNVAPPETASHTAAETEVEVDSGDKPDPNAVALAKLPKPAPSPSDEFFNKGIVPTLRVRLTQKEEQQLRADQRRYVDCTLIENETKTYKKVKVKLKGAAGSFRNLDDRPALTLSMKDKDDRFHGLKKFHLNNSVQDESYLSEMIAAQICADAGCPAARVTHARVYLNDRDLGFYVLKEGFDDLFLARHFSNPKGNLYDGGFCQDIDANLELDEGEEVMLADVKALVAACREGDQTKRWQMVQEKVDIDAFLNFVAMELMMSHWDGYCQNRNNYRIYFDADTKKVHFFPHGMDQMFGDPNFSVFHVPGPIVCNAVLSNPEWQKKYRERVRQLLPLFEPERIHKQIDTIHARVRPELEKIHPDRARHFDDRAKDMKNRFNDRQKNIRNQFPPEPIPLNAQGWALVEGWEPKAETDAKLEKKDVGGQKLLSIETGPSNRCVASFRAKVRLGKGSYRFEAKVKPTNVAAIPGDPAVGAGVRVSGSPRTTNQAVGTSDWQTVSHTIDVAEELREFELVAELRSISGSVLFDPASMRVVKVK